MKKEKMLVRNIGLLVNVEKGENRRRVSGRDMQRLSSIDHAALIVEDGMIGWYGPEKELPLQDHSYDCEINAGGGMVLPSFCDSHTHVLFAAPREQELFDRLNGLSYSEISAKGGGILNSARKLEQMSDEELLRDASRRLLRMMWGGTGTVEIKSGYGLTPHQEIRMLRLIRKLQQELPLTIRTTFLGAHAVPGHFRNDPDRYVDQIINEMLPQVGEEELADFVDVFCEQGFFTVPQTERICEAAHRYGLLPRLHANQFTHSGAIACAIRQNALSVDHLEVMNEEEIGQLAVSNTIPTLLPGCSFFMNTPYPPARRLIDSGLPVALASDYNPGTNPSGDMKFVVSLACLKMQMSVQEAIQAATLNGAAALGLSATHGSIGKGKRADFFITHPMPSLEYIPYAYTDPMVDGVVLGGELIEDTGF